MSISRRTLEHPIMTLIAFALIGAVGAFTLRSVAIALMPDIDVPYIMVSTRYPNAGPETVEESITKVLESSLISVGGLKGLSSSSSEGTSSISLEFDYGTDLDLAVADIRDKLDRVKGRLPDNADTPSILRMNANASPIIRIAVYGSRPVNELKKFADGSIADYIEQADGVAEVNVYGGQTAVVRVELEQNRLAAYGFTVAQISSALSKQNLELGGGKLGEGSREYIIRTTGQYTSIDDINNAVITTINGYDVRLKDVGRAFLGYLDKDNEVYINGQTGVYLSVTKQSGANTVAVANSVYEKMAELEGTLPKDITLKIIKDDTDSIRDTIGVLATSAWQGLLLAVIVLFIFLQNFKSTAIIAISVPFSIIITLFTMSLFKITLNMMTLTGLILGVGMIVDASIVMIDNIYSYRVRGAKPKNAAILGSQEVIASVVSGNLTTICVFVPFLLFINELEMMGQMFKGIIFTIVIALVSSLFVAVFLVPVLAGVFLPLSNRAEKPVSNPALKFLYGAFQKGMDAVTAAYRRVLAAALNNRATAVVIALCALAVSLAIVPTLPVTMVPAGNDDSVTLNITMPLGTPLSETHIVALAFEDIVRREVEGYKFVTTSVGSGGRGARYSYRASVEIALPDSDAQIDTAATIQRKLRAHFKDFAGARFSFGAGMRGQVAGSDIDIAIRSDDLDAALDVADKLQEVMEGIEAIGGTSIDMERGLPEVEVVIDRERAYSFGVDVSTVATEIYNAINGATSTTFRHAGDDYSIIVMYRPEDRKSVADLDSIYVRGTKGMVSVSNFASLKRGLGPVTIRRENQSRIIHVTAEIISGESANIVEKMIQDGVENSFVIPDNVSVSYEGSWQEIGRQMKVYLAIIIMAVILVFGVMASTYESFKAPLINLATIPFMIIGVAVLYKVMGQPVSIMAMVGLIMLVGIVVNNGIILVDYTNLLCDRGIMIHDACLEAGTSRLRPVLMTTLTTILGMLPMCLATDGQAAMIQPIGIAVVGGLTSSTFVTLILIPVLYSIVMQKKQKPAPTLKIDYPKEDYSAENQGSAEEDGGAR